MRTTTKPLVICVDDEPQVLEAIKLNVRQKFELLTATSGQQGLQLLHENRTPAVVLSDMRMPGMNGAEFLSQVRAISPDTVRMLLTGHWEVGDTVAAINEGQIFRFLTKPCSAADLLQAIRDGVAQYDLKYAEKVLLEQTLLGSVTAMMDMLSITNPVVFGQATRIRRLCTKIAHHVSPTHLWKLEVASLMSRMGWVALPGELVSKLNHGDDISVAENESVNRANELSEQLVRRIPRLDEIAEIIRGSDVAWSGRKRRHRDAAVEDISDKAQILRIATAFDALTSSGLTDQVAIESLRTPEGQFAPSVLDALDQILSQSAKDSRNVVEVSINQLDVGMSLLEDLTLTNGRLLAVNGYEITESFKERLTNFHDSIDKEKVMVVLNDPAATAGD